MSWNDTRDDRREVGKAVRWALTWVLIIVVILALIGGAAWLFRTLITPVNGVADAVETPAAEPWHPPLLTDYQWNLFHKEGR